MLGLAVGLLVVGSKGDSRRYLRREGGSLGNDATLGLESSCGRRWLSLGGDRWV